MDLPKERKKERKIHGDKLPISHRFEEEEEGTDVASDVLVVKVEVEDPATPGPLKRNDPGTVTIPQYWFNKLETK